MGCGLASVQVWLDQPTTESHMAVDLDSMLVVGVASSALFDLSESDEVFRTQGEDAYRKYQDSKVDETLEPGVAFEFVRRLLSLNDIKPDVPLVEVIVLSRNDPFTGLRVMRSIAAHNLPISRSIFNQGASPYRYVEALNMSLFLSANEQDVREANDDGLPAGRVLGARGPTRVEIDDSLRIAFDFDGVIADDESERLYQAEGMEAFREHERAKSEVALQEGRLAKFLRAIHKIQEAEQVVAQEKIGYELRLRVAIVTARNAPADQRVVRTLESWGVRVNDAFFLGGIEKSRVLKVLKPHIFFDDQLLHLNAPEDVPSVHIPFGVANLEASAVVATSEN